MLCYLIMILVVPPHRLALLWIRLLLDETWLLDQKTWYVVMYLDGIKGDFPGFLFDAVENIPRVTVGNFRY